MKRISTIWKWPPDNLALSCCASAGSLACLAYALHAGISIEFVFGSVLIVSLSLLSYIDIKSQLLPDIITIPLMSLGLIGNYFDFFADLQSAVLGAVIGYLVFVAVAYGYKAVRKVKGLGRGDAKLLAALGAWFGWQSLSSIVLIASVVVIALAICNPAYRHRGIHIPFGPCLAIGGAGWLFFG